MKKFTLLTICLMLVGCLFAQHTIVINLTTDNYGSETSWNLKDVASNTTIAQGGPYTDVSAAQTIPAISVDGTGCYVFTIYDAYGDGMQAGYGSGSYSVTYDNVTVATGGNFGSSMTHHIGGNGCPANEIAIGTITTASYVQINNDLTISGSITNNGTSLSSFDVTYKINDGNFVNNFTVPCNLDMFESTNFTHNIPASFTTAGTQTITIKVLNPNGETDNENDNETTITVLSYENAVTRKVLLEHFTTGQCPNCPPATANINTWLNSRPNVIWMSHHAGYYTDAFTIPENTAMCVFYNANGSTYAPAIMLDRYYNSELGEPGPVFFPSASSTPNLIDAKLAMPSFVSLEMEGTISVDNIVNVTINGEFIMDMPFNNLGLSLYIIEDGLSGPQSGASNYTHNHVVRDAISATNGDPDAFTATTAGSTFTKTYTFPINANKWNPANCKLVAFVNNWDPANVNNREVLNAEVLKVSDLSTGIDENSVNNAVIYPNPTKDNLYISTANMNTVEIVNALGQTVYTSTITENNFSINVANLTNGFYFIRLTGDNGSYTQKFIKE